MKYVLVDKDYNITTSVDLASNVGLSGAKTYFIGTKRIDEKNFDKLWKVMTKSNPVHRKHNFHKIQTILDYVKSVSVISGGEGGRAENLEQN